MLLVPDPLDPRFIEFDDKHEHRIYLDDYESVYAVVDAEDYWFFSRWRWKKGISKRGKVYARRSGLRYERQGGRKCRVNPSVYLHIEIMKRTGIQPPTEAHTIVDHRNGESLLCRRHNLRWATPQMNALNVGGNMPMDLMEFSDVRA